MLNCTTFHGKNTEFFSFLNITIIVQRIDAVVSKFMCLLDNNTQVLLDPICYNLLMLENILSPNNC